MGRKYKRLSADDLHVLWSRWFQGDTSVQISAVLGCDKDTVTWHVVRAGGVRPPERRRAARHLTLAEREEISRGLAQGEGVCAIARRLGRPASTISRELERHGGAVGYRAVAADTEAWAFGQRPKAAKLAGTPRLRRVVERKLKADWSPQQIAAWLQATYPDDLTMQVSHETIYQSLYVQTRGALKRELAAHLRGAGAIGGRGRRREPSAARGSWSTLCRSPSDRRVSRHVRCRATGKATCSWASAGHRLRRWSSASRASCCSRGCRRRIRRR